MLKKRRGDGRTESSCGTDVDRRVCQCAHACATQQPTSRATKEQFVATQSNAQQPCGANPEASKGGTRPTTRRNFPPCRRLLMAAGFGQGAEFLWPGRRAGAQVPGLLFGPRSPSPGLDLSIPLHLILQRTPSRRQREFNSEAGTRSCYLISTATILWDGGGSINMPSC